MCGIFQVYSRKRAIDRERFAAALQSMKHRGPDYTGVRFHEQPLKTEGGEVHIASGHQRLSILDLDPRSHQPFHRTDRCLLFNGEIYNFRELRAAIDDGTLPFTTTGDTEVLFYGLTRMGLKFLNDANGMWGFTFLDESTRRVLASRDRYGKKPVFYYHDDELAIFSSTIQAVHHYLGTPPRLCDDQVDSYLTHGMMFPGADEKTHIQGLNQIPAGHSLTFDLDRWQMQLQSYFNIGEMVRSRVPRAEELPGILRDAVTARLISDRKVGLLLSGGVDSTLVLATMHALGLQDQVHCFIGETGRSDDAEFAKKCVAQLGIEATVVNLDYGKGTFARLLKMCHHQEKAFPFLGSSMAMSEMYERIAEFDVRVVLDGTGGDEIFGGYWDRYFPIAVREAFARRDWTWLNDCWKNTPRSGALMFKAAREAALNNGLFHFDPRSFRKRFSPPALTLGLHRHAAPPSDPLTTPPARYLDAVIMDASPGGRLGEWIWHNDRNAMMSGIENRSPILDFRLVPFMGTGYANKFVREWNKHEMRKAFDALTPLPTQWRQQKQGFRWNGKVFIRENQQAILDLIAASKYLRSRFDTPKFVERAQKHRSYLFSSLTPRLLCIAGLEAEMGLASA